MKRHGERMTMKGCIFEVREFCVHDGPGVRTTVFFKGCPLRCRWCQNPEGLAFRPELLVNERPCLGCGNCRNVCTMPGRCTACGRCAECCPAGRRKVAGRYWEAGELAARLLRDREFLERSGGGVTFSGGEPLAQPEFFQALCDGLPGIHKAVETSGFAPEEVYREMLRRVDLVYQDLKHADPERHRELTGRDNAPILNNLELLKSSGKPFVIRIPVIPGCNGDMDNMEACAGLVSGAENLLQVQLLPYNPAAPAKYRAAGREFGLDPESLSAVDWKRLRAVFLRRGVPCMVL